VHGWVPWVDDPPESAIGSPTVSAEDLGIEPWRHLADLPLAVTSRPTGQVATGAVPTEARPSTPAGPTSIAQATPDVQRLVYDCVYYPFDSVSARLKRLCTSARAFEQAKRSGVSAGWIVESAAGQTLYLIATEKAFEAFGMPCPYAGRRVSLIHSFYGSLLTFLLRKDWRYRSVQPEVPLGKEGATSDVLAITRDGILEAWEVCLTTTHVVQNILKYNNTAHRIVLLARTYELAMAIRGLVKGAGLDPELVARIEYVHVSQLLRRTRKLSQY